MKMNKKPKNVCLLRAKLKEKSGDFSWKPFPGYEEICDKIIKTLNPSRGIFWKKRLMKDHKLN
jgi:hypothetical protein